MFFKHIALPTLVALSSISGAASSVLQPRAAPDVQTCQNKLMKFTYGGFGFCHAFLEDSSIKKPHQITACANSPLSTACSNILANFQSAGPTTTRTSTQTVTVPASGKPTVTKTSTTVSTVTTTKPASTITKTKAGGTVTDVSTLTVPGSTLTVPGSTVTLSTVTKTLKRITTTLPAVTTTDTTTLPGVTKTSTTTIKGKVTTITDTVTKGKVTTVTDTVTDTLPVVTATQLVSIDIFGQTITIGQPILPTVIVNVP